MTCELFFGFSDCRHRRVGGGGGVVVVFVLVRSCFDCGPGSAPVSREWGRQSFFFMFTLDKKN